MHTTTRRRVGAALTVMALIAAAPTPAQAYQGSCTRVAAGQTWTVTETTRLRCLEIEQGAQVNAAEGKDLSLTVNGVETGGVLPSATSNETVLAPGSYRGRVVLTVTDEHLVTWADQVFNLRQALYVDDSGVVPSQSVRSAYGGRVTDSEARGLRISSSGEAFTGAYLAADYTIKGARISLTGNGRSDFSGSGVGLLVDDGARVVVDHATIDNTGVARAGILATGGSNLIVKNSAIATHDGELPADYVSTVDLAQMRQAPWMLGIVGNVRTTNLMGEGTTATYINSDLSSTGWGVLSTDTGQDMQLTSINSSVTLDGEDGYGSYGIGDARLRFLGTSFEVPDYATIVRGATVHFGDSDSDSVSALNDELNLGLNPRELRRLPEQATTVDSDGFGVMWHGPGDVTIDGQTQFQTQLTAFQVKDQAAQITLDGSEGATVETDSGILVQVMPDDDPGPVMVDGKLVNAGVYTEPTTAPAKLDDFDVTQVHATDVAATFTDIELTGDLYNAARGDSGTGRNLAVTLDGASLTGVISSAQSRHEVDTITADNYEQIGMVTNTAAPAINNGAIVELTGSATWSVTGTSYLTSLTVSEDSTLSDAEVSVDGVVTEIQPGITYTGAIVVTPA